MGQFFEQISQSDRVPRDHRHGTAVVLILARFPQRYCYRVRGDQDAQPRRRPGRGARRVREAVAEGVRGHLPRPPRDVRPEEDDGRWVAAVAAAEDEERRQRRHECHEPEPVILPALIHTTSGYCR